MQFHLLFLRGSGVFYTSKVQFQCFSISLSHFIAIASLFQPHLKLKQQINCRHLATESNKYLVIQVFLISCVEFNFPPSLFLCLHLFLSELF